MFGYVTKDRNEEIYLHSEFPYYDDESGLWLSTPEEIDITGKFSEFDNISYNDEPIKVEIKLERV